MPGLKWTKLTLSQKVKIIEKSKKADFCADSRKNMCHEYGITDPTISTIIKHQEKILADFNLEVSTGQKTIIKAGPKGMFLSEDTDVFVVTPNRRTENLNFFE